MLFLFRNGMHASWAGPTPSNGRRRRRHAAPRTVTAPKGIAAWEGTLGHANAAAAGMSLLQVELGALGLQAAVEEAGAELQDIGGLLLEDFAFERGDFASEVLG